MAGVFVRLTMQTEYVGAGSIWPEVVSAVGVDGDGYAIGGGHLMHTLRRNPSLLYILMNNETKGQPSPTAVNRVDHEHPVDEIHLGLTIPGSTFLARAYVGVDLPGRCLYIRGSEGRDGRKSSCIPGYFGCTSLRQLPETHGHVCHVNCGKTLIRIGVLRQYPFFFKIPVQPQDLLMKFAGHR